MDDIYLKHLMKLFCICNINDNITDLFDDNYVDTI